MNFDISLLWSGMLLLDRYGHQPGTHAVPPVRSLARQWIGTGKSADYLELLNKRAFYFILTARLRPAAQGEG